MFIFIKQGEFSSSSYSLLYNIYTICSAVKLEDYSGCHSFSYFVKFSLQCFNHQNESDGLAGLDNDDPDTVEALAEFHFLDSEMQASGEFVVFKQVYVPNCADLVFPVSRFPCVK